MGHIAFGAPGIASYHLHERLRRLLQQRGHAVTVLCTDAAAGTFWRWQGESVVQLREAGRGRAHPDTPELPPTRDRRTRDWLARLQPAAARWFDIASPDLLLLHRRRSPDQLLLQQIARARGCRVLWCGDGLLPHTLQVDERGLDGDAAACRRSAIEFRAVQGDANLLQACLANALAATTPCALPRREPVAPPRAQRCTDALAEWRDHGFGAALRSTRAWAQALAPRTPPEPAPFQLPQRPFVAALLQDRGDPRLLHDASEAPGPYELVDATLAAMRGLDPGLELVVVDSPDGRAARGGAPDGRIVPAHAAAAAASIAVATVTVNHPLATAGLLAGTPVLHLGAALYGLRGVTVRTTLAELAGDLRTAVAHDHPSLRQRFLTWLLGYGHVWCSGEQPDHNGLLGFVQTIERRLQATAGTAAPLDYRVGPAWPLSVPARRQ